MVIGSEERRQELIGIIEQAFLDLDFVAEFLIAEDDHFPEGVSIRRRVAPSQRPMTPVYDKDPFEEDEADPLDEDWESADESDPNSETIQLPEKHGPVLFSSKTTKASIAYRLRALAQVYELILMDRHATKRDLFYESKSLYKFQSNFDRALTAVCKFLGASRSELNVVSCSKGFAIGDLLLYNAMDESEVDFRHASVPITEALTKFDFVQSDANFLLIVEKDAVFQRLLDEQWMDKFPNSILLTGRGYPDICTRQFLNWLTFQLPQLPMLVMVDADPYGVEIFLTYKFGSKHSQIESGFVHLPLLQWIGFFPSETEQLSIPVDQLLPLTESDKRKIDRIAERAFGLGEQYIFDELVILMRNNWKLEIEAISSLGNQFLSTVYLKYKLQQYQTAANNLEA